MALLSPLATGVPAVAPSAAPSSGLTRRSPAGKPDFDKQAAPAGLRRRIPAASHPRPDRHHPHRRRGPGLPQRPGAEQAPGPHRPPAGQPGARPALGGRLRRAAHGAPARQARARGRSGRSSCAASFAANKPWDELVREILSADGADPKTAAGRASSSSTATASRTADARHQPAVPRHEPAVRPVPRPPAASRTTSRTTTTASSPSSAAASCSPTRRRSWRCSPRRPTAR